MIKKDQNEKRTKTTQQRLQSFVLFCVTFFSFWLVMWKLMLIIFNQLSIYKSAFHKGGKSWITIDHNKLIIFYLSVAGSINSEISAYIA